MAKTPRTAGSTTRSPNSRTPEQQRARREREQAARDARNAGSTRTVADARRDRERIATESSFDVRELAVEPTQDEIDAAIAAERDAQVEPSDIEQHTTDAGIDDVETEDYPGQHVTGPEVEPTTEPVNERSEHVGRALSMDVAPVVEVANAQNVTARTICLSIKRGRFGNRRKASMSQVTVDSDKALLGLSKILLDSPELLAVQRLDNEVNAYLGALCLKSLFKGGVHLLPLGLVEEVDAALHAFHARRVVLVDAACTAYPQRIAETSERLNVMYGPRDYPSVDRFRAAFYMEWSYVTFDTPTRLKAINPAIFGIEREKAQAKLQAVAQECQSAMRVGLQDLVDKMVERLTPDADGKPKRFHKSLVENFNEFLRTFELRNVTDDAQLAGLVQNARAVMNGVDPKLLREDSASRETLAARFAEIQNALVPMTAGTRRIDFTDEVGDEA